MSRAASKAVLLVIAHPDDEAMFFTPTIKEIQSQGRDLFILCLSTGDFGFSFSSFFFSFFFLFSFLHTPL